MADLLLVGESPKEAVGKEFFLHCMDWWYEILQTIEACVDESYPFDAFFYRDLFLAPMTPHLTGGEAKNLAQILMECRQRGELGETLDRLIAASLDEDEDDWLEDRLDERLSQVDVFIEFLGSSGGCRAKWHGVEE
jgi:hypothetical protein